MTNTQSDLNIRYASFLEYDSFILYILNKLYKYIQRSFYYIWMPPHKEKKKMLLGYKSIKNYHPLRIKIVSVFLKMK